MTCGGGSLQAISRAVAHKRQDTDPESRSLEITTHPPLHASTAQTTRMKVDDSVSLNQTVGTATDIV